MKGFKIVNKTYQPFQLYINGKDYLLPSRGRENYIIVFEITPQIQNLAKKELIVIRKVR